MAVALAALALAAAAATRPEAARDLLAASALPARAAVAAGGDAVARLVMPPPRRRAVILTSVGIGLCAIPLAVLGVRRRRREDELDLVARRHQARAPQIFEAAFVTRPLRREAEEAAPGTRVGDGLPPLGPVPPEVASRAVALRAPSVREAAARAVLLRAASERSESRRRAAALRARSRRSEREEPSAPRGDAAASATPGVEPGERRPTPSEAPAAVARSRRAIVELALEIPETLRSAAAAGSTPAAPAAPTIAAAAPTQAAAAPERPSAEADEAASPARPGAGRVAILRGEAPLTFEWLERCLARDPQDFQARLDLCTALLVAERFADAERVAREGLARDDGDGRLLLRLSEALAGLGRTDEALQVAIRAVRRHRSRKAVLHLTRLSALARRFAPGDGPRLRKALESRPSDPVFLYALGVFESLHGSPRDALTLLRLALRQERTPRWRRIVSREIARLRADELAGTDRQRQRARA